MNKWKRGTAGNMPEIYKEYVRDMVRINLRTARDIKKCIVMWDLKSSPAVHLTLKSGIAAAS